MDKQQLKSLLMEAGVVQRGQFTLKSGEISSFYIDVRRAISYPQLLRAMAQMMWATVAQTSPIVPLQRVCGVPYGALPVTTCISVDQNLPMILCRKDAKLYGTKKKIEGVYQPGQNCLVVEDVMTTGSSLLGTIECLEASGLIVKEAVVLVDREQGGAQLLQNSGYQLHRVFTLDTLLDKRCVREGLSTSVDA